MLLVICCLCLGVFSPPAPDQPEIDHALVPDPEESLVRFVRTNEIPMNRNRVLGCLEDDMRNCIEIFMWSNVEWMNDIITNSPNQIQFRCVYKAVDDITKILCCAYEKRALDVLNICLEYKGGLVESDVTEKNPILFVMEFCCPGGPIVQHIWTELGKVLTRSQLKSQSALVSETQNIMNKVRAAEDKVASQIRGLSQLYNTLQQTALMRGEIAGDPEESEQSEGTESEQSTDI